MDTTEDDSLDWKTVDKLFATVPGSGYEGSDSKQEFVVRLGRKVGKGHRSSGGIDLDSSDDPERFAIVSQALGIRVEGDSLKDAKAALRKHITTSGDYSGEWSLWMQVEATGEFDQEASSYGAEEEASASIKTSFAVELATKTKKGVTKRHMGIRGNLADPFVGDYWRPKTHAELSDLRAGPAYEPRIKEERWSTRSKTIENPEVWVEATPENVAAVRELQRRLGEMGAKVQAMLGTKQNFMAALEAVKSGGLNLLGPGAT